MCSHFNYAVVIQQSINVKLFINFESNVRYRFELEQVIC